MSKIRLFDKSAAEAKFGQQIITSTPFDREDINIVLNPTNEGFEGAIDITGFFFTRGLHASINLYNTSDGLIKTYPMDISTPFTIIMAGDSVDIEFE